MSLRYGELFAGYHGLGMGLQSVLGGSTAWFSEFDKAPSAILAHHWPDVPNHGDVTKVDWTAVEPVDVLTGGSPCQDLSHAGKRAGMTDGTRSNLWVQMREAIAILRPRLVVWENVRGALSAPADSGLESCPRCVGDPRDRGAVLRALGRVVGDLSELGYVGWWHGLRAADVGAAHGRFRVFLFAVPADSLGVTGRFAADLGGLQRLGSSGGETDRPELTLLQTPAVNDMGEGKTVDQWDAWTEKMQAKHGNGNGHGKSLAIEAQRLLPTPRAREMEETPESFAARQSRLAEAGRTKGDSGIPLSVEVQRLLPTPTTDDAGNITRDSGDFQSLTRTAVALLPTPRTLPDIKTSERAKRLYSSKDSMGDLVAKDSWGDYAPAIARWETVIGRPAPAPTEPGPKGNPRLSAAFVEWLMGLPEGHVTGVDIPRNAQLKALGNGVVPQQAAAAARWFLAQIERTAA